jgi:hypothetical protein
MLRSIHAVFSWIRIRRVHESAVGSSCDPSAGENFTRYTSDIS